MAKVIVHLDNKPDDAEVWVSGYGVFPNHSETEVEGLEEDVVVQLPDREQEADTEPPVVEEDMAAEAVGEFQEEDD